MSLIYLDTETTGLDPDRHDMWEVAAITEAGDEHTWLLSVDMAKADPMALAVGGFHDRHPDGWNGPYPVENANPWRFIEEFGALTYGAHLVGAVPHFDHMFLRRLILERGYQPAWHYHLIDIEAMAVGWLHGLGWDASTSTQGRMDLPLPWRSDDLSRACGVEPPPEDERHTALGDARWVKRWYEALTGGSA